MTEQSPELKDKQIKNLTQQEKADAQLAEIRRQHEECGGDYITWARKYNRHTLKVCLINEQTGNESWCSGEEITFFNEDNAISHLGVVGEFLLLLAKNKDWGYKHTKQEVVDNILNPIKDRLVGEMNTYQDEEEEE